MKTSSSTRKQIIKKYKEIENIIVLVIIMCLNHKAVDALEQELKATQTDDRALRYYEEQVNVVKETYSEAIKLLESKLLQAKENFVKHQSLWESSRDRSEALAKEKSDLERKLVDVRSEVRIKEESDRREIASMRSELEKLQVELERTRNSRAELQERFRRLVAKDEESKTKVLEAIELVEAAVREKDAALQREARALEEAVKLESRLNRVVEDCTARLDRELAAARESFAAGDKKHASEIRELKVVLAH